MDEDDCKQWIKESHDYILNFLDTTEDDNSYLSTCTKCIIHQFLVNLKKSLKLYAVQNAKYDKDFYVTKVQLLNAQIASLRECIIELHGHLNTKEVMQ